MTQKIMYAVGGAVVAGGGGYYAKEMLGGLIGAGIGGAIGWFFAPKCEAAASESSLLKSRLIQQLSVAPASARRLSFVSQPAASTTPSNQIIK